MANKKVKSVKQFTKKLNKDEKREARKAKKQLKKSARKGKLAAKLLTKFAKALKKLDAHGRVTLAAKLKPEHHKLLNASVGLKTSAKKAA